MADRGFSRRGGGSTTELGTKNLMLAENCMKMKTKIGPRGGGVTSAVPDPQM